MPPVAAPQRPSAARHRLLSTATALFYTDGIRAVGVDRVIERAGVTRATFYRHFPSKDDLVVAYLRGVHDATVIAAGSTPGPVRLRRIVVEFGDWMGRPGFRGCAFINAAAEYPDPASPVHHEVVAHHKWLLALFRDDLAAAGHSQPDGAAAHLLVLRDGAMVSGYLGDPGMARTALVEAVERAIADAS